MTLPSVSVVVLNWNGQAHLRDCLTALLAQTYAGPFEVVLADNGSDDGSVELVQREFPHVGIIRSPKNLGFAGGNNFAARRVESDAIAFINNDTRADHRWLEELVLVLRQAPEVACVGGKILSWDGGRIDFVGGGATLTGFGLQFDHGERTSLHDRERDILFTCGGSMLAWREPFLRVGGFDEDYFAFYEDVDLGWRYWLAGYRVRFAPRSIVYHRHHGTVSRIAEERLAVLYERNALFTIYKNYDDVHLAAVLPVALLLAAEKATLLSDPDRREFALPAVTASAPAPTPRLIKTRDFSRFRNSVREQGYVETMRRLQRAAVARLGPRVERLRATAARRIGGRRGLIPVPQVAMSRLLALEQFGNHLTALQEKRKAVQALRRRPDDEILQLFGMPLEPGFPAAGFAEYHRRLVHAFGLDRWAREGSREEHPVPHA